MNDDGELYDERRIAAVDRATAILAGVPLSMDAIAGAAASVASAPMGVVSLVDGEWDRLVGLYGVDGVFKLTRRIAVADSLCRTVVASGEPVWIADTASDPRSAGAAVVSYVGIGAFAAVPLRGSDGAVVGSICALDAVPREWNADQRAALDGVAATTGLLPGIAGVAAELTVNLLDLVPLLDALAESFVVVDGDGAILAWNAAATTTFGWTRDQALGHPLHQLLFPDRDAVTIRAILATLAALPSSARGAVRRQTMWATTRDGLRMPVDAAIRAVPGAGGTRICVSMLDASLRFDAEAEVIRREGFLQAVLNSLDTAVFACDTTGRPIFGNPALLNLMETQPSSLIDAALRLRMHVRDVDGKRLDPADYPSNRALAGETVRDVVLGFHAPGRPPRRFLANAEPILVGAEASGAVVALRDVTEVSREQHLWDCELDVARLLLRTGYTPETAGRLVETVAAAVPGARVRLWLVDPAPTADASSDETVLELVADSAGRTGRMRLCRGDGTVGAAWADGAPIFRRSAGGPAPADAENPGVVVPVPGIKAVLGVLDAELPDEADPDEIASHLSRVAADLGHHLDRRG
ncbi:PAS domain-containing protein [Cryptosporangium aurantiacum]|uniref:PAS domain S-box-containing protein n=1 Tax=Cryptosporangium aurantiacum TaxID=134849 RepID=A0A1M7RMN1_9ACTN|nr:PAS domain-containing protein [Cryptosporangium aurantiacum]SHN47595.1 PAS domain S-box-containing protein [Cryptosporangium aurantiacum]